MPRRPEARPTPSARVPEAEDRAAALRLVPVSRETEARLATYVDLLRRWQGIKNLVGPATLQAVWTRHVADCAQLPALLPAARRWVDLGSGAGFPGLVVAIMLAGQEGAHVDLVESNNRKCAFLREVARETGAPAAVHAGRIEDVVPGLAGPVDAVTSRALAPVPVLLELAAPLFRRGATGLFLTGETQGEAGAEEGDAPDAALWQITRAPSKTSPAARILMVRPA